MPWIKCHDTITQGLWHGVPRAHRFVLLELSLLARPGDGSIVLPAGHSDPIAATMELLGGDKRQARRAICHLVTLGSIVFETKEHLSDGSSMSYVGPKSAPSQAYVCRIPDWSKHNRRSTSAARMRYLRSKSKGLQADSLPCDASHERHVTQKKSQRDENVTLLDKRREDKKRKDKKKAEASASPDLAEVWDYFQESRRKAIKGARDLHKTEKRVAMINARLKTFSKDDLMNACSALLANPFNVQNGFTNPEICYRNEEQVEKYLNQFSAKKQHEQLDPFSGQDERDRVEAEILEQMRSEP